MPDSAVVNSILGTAVGCFPVDFFVHELVIVPITGPLDRVLSRCRFLVSILDHVWIEAIGGIIPCTDTVWRASEHEQVVFVTSRIVRVRWVPLAVGPSFVRHPSPPTIWLTGISRLKSTYPYMRNATYCVDEITNKGVLFFGMDCDQTPS